LQMRLEQDSDERYVTLICLHNQSINQGFYSRWGQLAHLTKNCFH